MSLRVSRLPLLALCAFALVAFVSWLTGHLDWFNSHSHVVLFGMALSDAQVTSLNTAAADFKEYMDQGKVFDLIWSNNPELTLMGKNDEVSGLYYDNTVKYAGSQGVSLGNGYQNSLRNQTPERYATFHVPMANLYAIGTLKNNAIKASRNKAGAFEELVQGAMRSALKNCANEISRAMMGSGTATIGQVAAIELNPAGFAAGCAKVRLSSPLSYQFFENGMTVDSTATDGSAPQGTPDTVTVAAVDAGAGILVFNPPSSGAWNAGYWIVGAFLIRDGNYNANAFSEDVSTQNGVGAFTPANFAGMGAWNPSYEFRQNPGLSVAQFFNVNRGKDGTRLAGLGIDGRQMAIDKALIYAAVQTGIYSDGAEYCSLNPTSYNALLNILQGQKLYEDVEVTAKIAYRFLVIEGGPKPLKVINSRNVPPKVARLWSPGDYELASMGPMIAPLPYGDMEFLPLQDDDANQFRAGGYGNIVLKNTVGVASVSLNQ
jgi:hypothetical protein